VTTSFKLRSAKNHPQLITNLFDFLDSFDGESSVFLCFIPNVQQNGSVDEHWQYFLEKV